MVVVELLLLLLLLLAMSDRHAIGLLFGHGRVRIEETWLIMRVGATGSRNPTTFARQFITKISFIYQSANIEAQEEASAQEEAEESEEEDEED